MLKLNTRVAPAVHDYVMEFNKKFCVLFFLCLRYTPAVIVRPFSSLLITELNLTPKFTFQRSRGIFHTFK